MKTKPTVLGNYIQKMLKEFLERSKDQTKKDDSPISFKRTTPEQSQKKDSEF